MPDELFTYFWACNLWKVYHFWQDAGDCRPYWITYCDAGGDLYRASPRTEEPPLEMTVCVKCWENWQEWKQRVADAEEARRKYQEAHPFHWN